MKHKLLQMPLIKTVLPLIAGIFIFGLLNVSVLVVASISLLLFIIVLLLHRDVKNPGQKNRISILVYILLFFVGGAMISAKHLSQQKTHFSVYTSGTATAYITQPIKETEKSYKTVLAISELVDSQFNLHPVHGKLLVYFAKDSSLLHLSIGDKLIFPLKYQPIQEPKNPYQFDYKNYLAHKTIFQQQYLQAAQLKVTGKKMRYTIRRYAYQLSLYAQKILTKYIPEKSHLAFAKGILLGISDDIDDELYNEFAYTGILHILSVSGLHVGIIYGILMFFLSLIKDKSKKTRITKAIFVITFIWTFAFVTGLSSACVRAAILFTLLTFGTENKIYFNNLNLLAGSALIQLLLDANLLFDVGFQLSYLAMLGLFIFYKPFYSLWYVRHNLLDKIWKLWAASLAAQVFTIPLSIYYFGNFPVYFLIANIFAIPLSAVILWLCIGLVFFSWIPFVGYVLGLFLSTIMYIFIALTAYVAHLPFGKLNTLHLLPLQLVILFVAVILFTFFIEWKKPKYLMACLSLCLITLAFSYFENIKQLQQNELIFYSIPKKDCIAFNEHSTSTIFVSDSLSTKDYTFNLLNAQRYYDIQQTKQELLDSIQDYSYLLFFKGKTIYLLNKKNQYKDFSSPLKIDYLYLSDNIYLDIGQVLKNYQFKSILIGTSNDYRHQHIFEKILKENKLNYYNLSEKALVISL